MTEHRTIVAEQELVVTRAEHAHGPTGLASFSQLLESRIITLRYGDALEATITISGSQH